MVKFGKFLKSVRRSRWSNRYFYYKQFRTLLHSHSDIRGKFFHLVDSEVAKLSRFIVATVMEKRTALVRLGAQLAPAKENLLQERSVRIAAQYAHEVLVLAKEIRELVMFIDVNLVAVHKVLKKYNKKTNSLTAHEYMQVRRQQPDSPMSKLWDTSLIEAFANDLETVASYLSSSEETSDALLEHVEMVEILSEQIKDTVAKGDF